MARNILSAVAQFCHSRVGEFNNNVTLQGVLKKSYLLRDGWSNIDKNIKNYGLQLPN